ncbi:hypothetical protein EC973_000764 [Apophysomyces ossiformis]|uniref:MAS20-domain-containing protein n=1 Tax=Apophysomyces ossiformis TaxID=679940 RepID=A0A8H7BN01_9FUNG|nr:hypothetical protein EC973_000764 [Apophysomyces ossiformis]
MTMKPQTIALLSAGVVLTAGVGYLIYFDHKRRNDPNLRKKLRRERKKVAKQAKAVEEEAKASLDQLIESVLAAVANEEFPTTPEEKEKYFMAQVAAGEGLCNQGEAHYKDSVLPFYRALKVYPAPLELIMIYQKTIPMEVFQIVVRIMSLEQQKRQNQFYEEFPPSEMPVKLGELPAGITPEGKPIIRRGLVARKDVSEGEVLYTESPLVSALHPGLEGSFCNFCLRKLQEEKVECANCDKVAFCSADCEKQATQIYHQFLCVNNKSSNNEEGKEGVFLTYSNSNNLKYPQMIAQFLSGMVAEEIEKNKAGKSAENTYSAWDHIDRFRYLDTAPSQSSTEEIQMIKNVLGAKVPGIDEFLTDEIYLMLKGKLGYNTYPIPLQEGEDVEVPSSSEVQRELSQDRPSVGAALYKISTYLGHSEEPNVSLKFNNNHEITVIASKDIKKDEELKAAYILPKPQ